MDSSQDEKTNSIRTDIPKIVEDLIPKTGDEAEGDDSMCDENDNTTESDVRINKSDHSKILRDHDNPGITTDIKPSGSLVNITQGLEDNGSHQNHLNAVENNTSDEDISELASEQPSPMPRKQRLRISLRNLSDSDDEIKSNCTEDSAVCMVGGGGGGKGKKKRLVI